MDNIIPLTDRETIEHEAREWLVRLDSDDPLQAADKQALQQWLAQSPAHTKELQRLAEFWDSSNILTELLVPMQQVAAIQQPRASARSLWARPRYVALAVSVLFAVVIIGSNWLPPSLDSTNGIYASAIGELREQTLADGSVLQINTDSQVQVSYSEHSRKIRLLRGEAHFKVAHNPQWPFEVYAGRGRVKALGTAFLVRLEQEQLSVIVTDGRVDLAAPVNSTPVLETVGTLNKGQGVSFNASQNPKAQQPLAEKDITRQLAWREGYLQFQGEPLAVVVAELNRYLPMPVTIVDDNLNSIPIGGRFKVKELNALFEVLETSFNVRVSYRDDQSILLSNPTAAAEKIGATSNATNNTTKK